jgi:hypothetical protein
MPEKILAAALFDTLENSSAASSFSQVSRVKFPPSSKRRMLSSLELEIFDPRQQYYFKEKIRCPSDPFDCTGCKP